MPRVDKIGLNGISFLLLSGTDSTDGAPSCLVTSPSRICIFSSLNCGASGSWSAPTGPPSTRASWIIASSDSLIGLFLGKRNSASSSRSAVSSSDIGTSLPENSCCAASDRGARSDSQCSRMDCSSIMFSLSSLPIKSSNQALRESKIKEMIYRIHCSCAL